MGMNHLSFGYEASKLWVRIILALGTNHLNFGYESSGYETSVGTKRPVSLFGHASPTITHECFIISVMIKKKVQLSVNKYDA